MGWEVLGAVAGAVGLGWYVAIWTVCLLGWQVAYRNYGNPYPRSPLSSVRSSEETDALTGSSQEAPGVSVLRPLAGLDCNLFTNLCSLFEQQYPRDRFEVILSVMSERDQALPVARQVVARYPHISSRIVVGRCGADAGAVEDAGVNPKINNLVRPYAETQYDIVWVVDSQVWLGPQAMSRAVDALTMKPTAPPPSFLRRAPHGERVGMVHHVPLGVLPANTWGSHIERAFLSTTHAKMYLAINAVAVDSCVMGKSNMYRKSDLAQVPDAFFAYDRDAIGSRAFEAPGTGEDAYVVEMAPRDDVVLTKARPLARFGIYLAEDNMLALSLWRAPLSLAHRIAPGDVAHVAVGDIQTIAEYAKRRMRWIRVRRHMVPAATYLEPFTESLVAGVVGWVGVYYWLVLPVLGALQGRAYWALCGVFYALHLAVWYYVDTQVLSALRCGNPLPDAERRYFFGAWCLRELFALPIWVWAMAGSTVTWRGKRYRILRDARAARIEARGPALAD
ncbi:ceramide glucosyltransferase [Malassezia obtusa]|uniref:Ceramide glucosyltransferase n=1 Tax=Malassezia obtusa TaxID=76774 RepID=A0AAF0DZF4_9BASI|nr:ceramide glucosyltransferase [Malassezia obtusa]